MYNIDRDNSEKLISQIMAALICIKLYVGHVADIANIANLPTATRTCARRRRSGRTLCTCTWNDNQSLFVFIASTFGYEIIILFGKHRCASDYITHVEQIRQTNYMDILTCIVKGGKEGKHEHWCCCIIYTTKWRGYAVRHSKPCHQIASSRQRRRKSKILISASNLQNNSFY